MKIREKTLPFNDPSLAMTNNKIGTTYLAMGEYSTALPYLKNALKILKQATSCSPVALADAHGNLAYALSNLAGYDEALPHAEQALNISIDIFGPNHPKSLNYASFLQGIIHEF